jgi:hypothetical protein
MDNRKGTIVRQCASRSRLDRRLVELHEYANREGITPQDVTKCSEIGIIHLRRHKGKTFVVDMPICSYENSEQIDAEVAELLGLIKSSHQAASLQEQPLTPSKEPVKEKQAPKSPSWTIKLFGKFLQRGRKAPAKAQPQMKPPYEEQKPNTTQQAQTNQAIEPGSISQLVQEMLTKAEQIKNQEQMTDDIQPARPITEMLQISKKKLSKHTEELLQVIHKQLDEMERKNK